MKKIGKGSWIAALAIVAAIVIFTIVVSNKKNTAYMATDYAMSTVIQFQLYGSDAANKKEEMMNEIHRLEKEVMSWRIADSEIAKLNSTQGEMCVSDELYNWLLQIEQIEQDSGGALDVTILPLAQLWNIEGENPVVPRPQKIADCLAKVDYTQVSLLDHNTITMRGGVQIDIGAVGKGIVCDRMSQMMDSFGQTAGTIAAGGSICVKGKKPNGEAWNMGIQDPRGANGEVLGIYSTREECFISTSGDYEKYFEENGIRYHHILNPNTGYPADSGLISVTVIADDGLVSDALSTACFILGKEKGKELAEQYNAQVVFVDEKKNVYVSEAIKTKFQLKAAGYRIKEW